MKIPHRPKPQQASALTGAAGRVWRPSAGRFIVALLVVAGIGALVLTWMPSGSPPAPEPAPAVVAIPAALATPPLAPAPPSTASHKAQPVLPEGDADPTRDLSSYVARGENPSMAQVIGRLHERGVYSGLGAFSPPGTSPPLVGLAVPKEFVLPAGYVRHHQATDDGQPIEAMLMFAPDFQLRDAANRPIAMPKNRVVPPELAPPGLPIRLIVVPANMDPASAGR